LLTLLDLVILLTGLGSPNFFWRQKLERFFSLIVWGVLRVSR